MPLYLAIAIPLVFDIAVTISLIKYFPPRQAEITIHKLVNRVSGNLGDRTRDHLYNYLGTRKIKTQNYQAEIASQTANYLQQIDLDLSTKIIIIDKQGEIIASNYHRQEDKSSLTTQDILSYLRKQFGNFSEIEKVELFSYETKQQRIWGRVTPWQEEQLGLDWLAIVTIAESELTTISSSIEQSDQLLPQYLAYLLPTIVSGIIIYLLVSLFIKNQTTKQLSQIAQDSPIATSGNYDQNSLLLEMSHDLRSPLNSILGFVQIMNKESSMTRSQLENLAIINRSGKRLLSVINDLVDLSKIETNRLNLEHNNFDFALWLDNMEQNIKFQARDRGLEFSLIRNGNLPQYICLDERRLRQILTTLIDYSFRYNRTEETIVTVTCSEVSGDSIADEPVKSQPNQRFQINFVIENQDFPITSEELNTLFDPLARVRQKYESSEVSPLSLPISRHLAQLMGGDITVSNHDTSPRGIIFQLHIQAEIDTTLGLQIEFSPKKIIGLEPDDCEYRILIVDDSKTNRKIMVQLLEPVGFKVKEAVNGKEAVDIWLHWQPHMIWMDIRMPVMNGYEATEQIKSYSQTPSTPIVALTAGTLEEERSLFQASGCDDFVGKPFTDSIIFDKIAQHLGVRYVYESTSSSTSSNFKLTSDALKIMPNSWLSEVKAAAATLDGNLLTQLLEQIPPNHSDLKEGLQNQVDNFDFDKILALVRDSQDK
ncbi:MAG: hybrid sensor histidine kinase/response regulator [Pleurocapsa sp.]